jgi:hypothetical protein
MFTDVREAYPNVRIDWNQRNLIAGVPVYEQVDKRVAIVRDEVQTRIRKDEIKKGRALNAREKGQLIKQIVTEGASKVKASDVFPDRSTTMTAEQKLVQETADKHRHPYQGTLETQTDSIQKRALDATFKYCSDAVLQALSPHGAPRFYRVKGWDRGYAARQHVPLGETGGGVVIVAPYDYQKVLDGTLNDFGYGLSVLTHEGSHVVDSIGKTNVAARVIRSRFIRDVTDLTEGEILIYGKERGIGEEYGYPGKFVDRYDGRVSGKEADNLKKKVGKPFQAKDYQGPETVDEYEVDAHTEFLSQAVMRIESLPALGLNWETAADQVAFMISALRGHYVPH